MIDTLYATKKNLTQAWTKSGKRIPVTVLATTDHTVVQVKTQETDGYAAVQVALGSQKKQRINKPSLGHLAKHKVEATPRYMREVKVADHELESGARISVDQVIKVGDKVKVAGNSKGTGFTGVMKRWNFAGGPRTHGQSDRGRAPGSIGQGTTPGRVWKGKKMAGRNGNERLTVRNLLVVKIDAENGEIWIKGTVPGHTGTLVEITKTAETQFEGLLHDALVEAAPQTEENEVAQAESTEAPAEAATETNKE